MTVIDLTEIEMEISQVKKEVHRGITCYYKFKAISIPDGSKIFILANEEDSVFVDEQTYKDSKLPNY